MQIQISFHAGPVISGLLQLLLLILFNIPAAAAEDTLARARNRRPNRTGILRSLR